MSKKKDPAQSTPRDKTTFKCSQCDVYLCIGDGGANCFYDFHTKVEYWVLETTYEYLIFTLVY